MALSRGTINEFLEWAARVPHGEARTVREQISLADKEGRGGDLAAGLFAALDERPVPDFGRHLVLLATIGALRDARALPRLEAFVWSEEPMFPPPNQAGGDATSTGDAKSLLNFRMALQARAAEMLSYLATDEARRATLRIAADHPERPVRAAAIDAHLYNQGDTAEAVREVLSVVRPEDAKLVGLPRLTAGMSAAEFDRRVNAFYDQYPEERPPLPERGPGPGERPRTPPPRERGGASSPEEAGPDVQ
ncbi:hypothetical protein ACH4PU_12200 [Streptomyces sp. NPDC021100]|uniref:hypothetical protein n=1 Tax=Streptomyces sp. NPDC021100 TaxID=3365114 RepID=UPI003790FE05